MVLLREKFASTQSEAQPVFGSDTSSVSSSMPLVRRLKTSGGVTKRGLFFRVTPLHDKRMIMALRPGESWSNLSRGVSFSTT